MGTEGVEGVEDPVLLPLGTGSIRMPGGRAASGYRLSYAGQHLHLDFGPGNLLRLAEAGEEGWEVERILFSHYHIDHHADLLPLLFLRSTLRYDPELGPRKKPLRLYGPRGLREIYEGWVGIYGAWVEDGGLEIQEFGSGEGGEMRIGPFEVTAYPARHSQPAFCYRIRMGAKVFAYSGDSGPGPGLVAACKGADYAILECSFPSPSPGHLCPAELRSLLEEAQPKRVGLTHFYPEMEALLRGAKERGEPGIHFPGLESEVQLLQDLGLRT